MNGLANWDRLIKALSICATIAFVLTLWWAQTDLSPPRVEISRSAAQQLFTAYKSIQEALGTALAVTGVLFWVFTKWLWRLSIFRKLDFIKFPDLSGTWHATLYPGEWNAFTTVVSIDHSFSEIRVSLIRDQSLGRSLTTTLARTDGNAVRLYVAYYSKFGERRTIAGIPAVDHGEDHNGTLFLDLNDEAIGPEGWVLQGEYWTNKRRDPHDDHSKGTWGRIAMGFKRRDSAPAAVGRLPPEDIAWLSSEGTSLQGERQDLSAA